LDDIDDLAAMIVVCGNRMDGNFLEKYIFNRRRRMIITIHDCDDDDGSRNRQIQTLLDKCVTLSGALPSDLPQPGAKDVIRWNVAITDEQKAACYATAGPITFDDLSPEVVALLKAARNLPQLVVAQIQDTACHRFLAHSFLNLFSRLEMFKMVFYTMRYCMNWPFIEAALQRHAHSLAHLTIFSRLPMDRHIRNISFKASPRAQVTFQQLCELYLINADTVDLLLEPSTTLRRFALHQDYGEEYIEADLMTQMPVALAQALTHVSLSTHSPIRAANVR
jgi:hypothetical protein